ncbi:low molecular weight protein-tyrosine-phosphatase [Flavobacterium sp.]|uniref:low molecular weight protein-tyrosine-phosphatase n=1 Tax=Flavobacterium sp. TaxID=239 RepID=UPI00261056F1|nr:low molecular weight protein-tyrosine-phosphatase [Flavobacterium sp.]
MITKILMVCLGNICRSPLAEGILADKLPRDRFAVDSAGTGNYHVGKAPDARSIKIAKLNNIDITGQIARQFKPEDFFRYDYIYAMDQSNLDDILELAPNEEMKSKARLILDELFPGEKVDVPDPYYGHDNGFTLVYQMLDEACTNIANRLLDENRRS